MCGLFCLEHILLLEKETASHLHIITAYRLTDSYEEIPFESSQQAIEMCADYHLPPKVAIEELTAVIQALGTLVKWSQVGFVFHSELVSRFSSAIMVASAHLGGIQHIFSWYKPFNYIPL